MYEEITKRERKGWWKGEKYAERNACNRSYGLGSLDSLHGEDKEIQLRITLRWRLMGGNKKGHRVATAAPMGGGNFPPPHDTDWRRRGRSPPTPCRTYFSYQARFAPRALGDLRVASGPRRAKDQDQCCSIRDEYQKYAIDILCIGKSITNYSITNININYYWH